MPDKDPIPEYLVEAFGNAIRVCRRWSGDDKQLAPISVARVQGEPTEPHTADAVCGEVSDYQDEMPDQFVEWLLALPWRRKVGRN
jgi:hypothetical protein